MDTRLILRLRAGWLALSVVAVSVTACGGYSPSEPYVRQIGVVLGPESAQPNIVGTWQRSIVFIDEYGFINNFETIWTFESTGGALRSDITENVSLEVADTVFTPGLWRFDGPLVVINFLEPTPGQLRMDVLVQGNLMFLGGQEFLRVECCATPR